MNKKNVYSRKISLKEADKDFILILKNKLSLFPELGEKFDLEVDNSNHKVEVESYPCTCRGPDRPHEHYFIRWKGLEAGNRIDIIKFDNESNYSLKIH
jgi:hypothetical protein